MEYSIGIKPKIYFNDEGFSINNKKYNYNQVLSYHCQSATPREKGNIVLLMDDYDLFNIELIYSFESQEHILLQKLSDHIGDVEGKILGFQCATYNGGHCDMAKLGNVNIVLFKDQIVISNVEETIKIKYADIKELKYDTDSSYKLKDYAHNYLLNFVFYGPLLGGLLSASEQNIVKKYVGKLCITDQNNNSIILYSIQMNELYTILYKLKGSVQSTPTHEEKPVDNKSIVVKYIPCKQTENDAILLENVLNEYKLLNYDVKDIISRENDFIVIFNHQENTNFISK